MRKWFGPYFTTNKTVEREPGQFKPSISNNFEVQISKIEEMVSSLNGLQLPYDQHVQLVRDSRARNAFGTASIEGNPITLGEVESLMARAPSPSRDLIADEVEIMQWLSYMENLDAKRVETTEDLLIMHDDLLGGIIESPGEFKTHVNFVADSKKAIHYLAGDPAHTIPDLEHLLSWYRRSQLHPLLKIGLFFHEFQSIHPFSDGNGRIGRAIATIQIHQAGYDLKYAPLDYALNTHQWEYYDALQETRVKKDHKIWLSFWLSMLEVALHSGQQRATLQRELPDLHANAVRIAEWAGRMQLGHPQRQFAFNDVATAFPQIPERSLRRHLATLVDEDILSRSGIGRGSRYNLSKPRQPSKIL